jgi:signal transduction histidine kinase
MLLNPLFKIRVYTALLIITCLFVVFSSCRQKKTFKNDPLRKELQSVDRFYFNDRYDTVRKILARLRPQISASNPLIVDYYYQMNESFVSDSRQQHLFSDSAMAFFSDAYRIKEYPDEYFKALIMKGTACMKSGKYILALNYYFKCKNILALGVCDNGELAGKLGVIYYAQKNYELAAKNWAESYSYAGKCNKDIPIQKLFFLKQGALDNAAFAYEQAGITDSANYYYLKDIDLINNTRKEHLIDTAAIDIAQAVADDNFGGLNLTTGNLPAAKYYLEQSVAFPVQNNSASGVSAYIKLANLYVQLGYMPKAAAAFAKSRYLIDHYNYGDPNSEIMWKKAYSQFLFKSNNIAGAYQYLEKYNSLKTLQDKNNTNLYRLDVVREFNALQQKQSLSELEQSNRQKKVYILGTIVIVILFIVIISLIYCNLKKTKKNNKLTTLQNTQLQHTLLELEQVNKNYIRVMRVMAHDLRNPLSGMTGLAAVLLEDEGINEESRHMLRLIESTGLHTIEMISELLRTGLGDENEKVEKQLLDIRALVFDSAELLQFKANDKQQHLLFEGDHAPVIANINHEKVWRVMNNLIVNAIKFSHNNGVIKIAVKANAHHVLISIADSGVGIPDNQKDVIFEMFTPAKRPGTDGEQPFGLGLSISKRIIEMHNGKIWFESREGKGTTFFVQLPLK